jgi:hypothetical protein
LGLKKDEVTREWRILRNKELYDLVLLTNYNSSDKIKNSEMGGACGTYGRQERYIQNFGGET